MNVDPGSNGHKRSLDYNDQYSNKRHAIQQPEIDLEALVAELNQHAQQAGPGGGYDDSQSLEKQLEGALASLNAQSNDQHISQPGLQYPMHPPAPGVHYGHQNQLGVSPQVNLELPGHSKEYESHLESQLEGKIAEGSNAKESALMEAKKRCLPILDSLACQILEYLSTGHYHDVLNVVGQPDSERGRAFRAVIDIFEQTKKMFMEGDDPFIHYSHDFRESRITIQRANLASWCAAVFGVVEIGFHDLDKWFMTAFVPETSRLLKSQTSIYLELKTQAYISSLSQNQRTPETVLDELFPKDLANQMLSARSDRQALNNSESDFANRCLKRRENIEGNTDQLELAKTYQWVFFLRDLTEYISKHHYALLPHPAQQLRNAQLQKKQQQEEAAATSSEKEGHDDTEASKATPKEGDLPLMVPAAAPPAGSTSPRRSKPARRELGEEAKMRAAQNNGKVGESNVVTLYNAAKATSEGIENSRPARSSVMSRRAWSKEEERALLEGLDKVQGPYWSQILELYGPGGSISEILKDRNQVQLKDKARNLKMFFVRCNMPIPAVFQYVTGNYETRKSSGKKSRERRRAEERASPVPGGQRNMRTIQAHPHQAMQNPIPMQNIQGPQPLQPEEDVQQSAEALDKALSMLKGTDDNFQHLIQSVGDYINNQ